MKEFKKNISWSQPESLWRKLDKIHRVLSKGTNKQTNRKIIWANDSRLQIGNGHWFSFFFFVSFLFAKWSWHSNIQWYNEIDIILGRFRRWWIHIFSSITKNLFRQTHELANTDTHLDKHRYKRIETNSHMWTQKAPMNPH